MDKGQLEYMEKMQERVTKGERTRILYECFLDALGLNYESTFAEVVERMRETQKEYQDAVNYFGELMKVVHTAKVTDNEPVTEETTEGVSVSHN